MDKDLTRDCCRQSGGRCYMLVSQSGRHRYDTAAVAERLELLGLDDAAVRRNTTALQELEIEHNIDKIVDEFCDSLLEFDDFIGIVTQHSSVERIKEIQRKYLRSLGVNCDRPEYFEERLRIGAVHQRIGVPQSLYQCRYQQLQQLLIENIPQHLREDRPCFEELLQFILKITALDMSLAGESYCAERVSGLQKSLRTERGESERLRRLSITDWLTDLHNHSYSRRCLSAALDRAKRGNEPLCVIMADLDHFKEINDTHGHLVGDEVLRIAAARMVSGARANDQVGRYGGEEFILILKGTDLVEGVEVAERVRSRIRSDVIHSGDATIRITLSLGLAQSRDEDTVDTLIDRADTALYAAKRAGRDCVRIEAEAARLPKHEQV